MVLSLLHKLDGFLARQMLDVETDGEHTGEAVLQFLLQGFFLVGVVAVAEDSGDGQFLRLILHDADAAEGYHAAEIGGVLRLVYSRTGRSNRIFLLQAFPEILLSVVLLKSNYLSFSQILYYLTWIADGHTV